MTMLNQTLPATERTRVRRHSERAQTSRADLLAVLDTGLICHLGVVVDGSPVVLPTAYGRIGDTLYLHGSSANRSLHAADGHEVCITVSHFDGLVCARAAFAHSVNYRSAVVFGTARMVTGEAERLTGLRAVTEQLVPGRWDSLRAPTRKELAATSVLAVPLAEASVKVRTGPPKDDPDDLESSIWAGVVPLVMTFGEPEPDPGLPPNIGTPEHIRARIAMGSR
jgi:nitroimidazol reductase NimA-like FMN-containing flavoprotein (pyridoxamine 5'-phosphate oxidase superfamily)